MTALHSSNWLLDDFDCAMFQSHVKLTTTTSAAATASNSSPSNPQAPRADSSASPDSSIENRMHINPQELHSSNHHHRRKSSFAMDVSAGITTIRERLPLCFATMPYGFCNHDLSVSQQHTEEDESIPPPRRRPQQQEPTLREHEEIEVLPNHRVQVRLPPDGSSTANKVKLPLDTLEVTKNRTELERCISELTMRSSYAAGSESLNKIPDNRRMAYYAVGKRGNARGGNRRCYFTGKLILGNMPFYAGSVQQGLRTLVVFCLPSALGLPTETQKAARASGGGLWAGLLGPTVPARSSSKNTLRSSANNTAAVMRNYYNSNHSVASKGTMSRLSSLDDLSLSIDGDLDPNWGMDRDYLLSVLPEASPALLKQMEQQYPTEFDTLPVQVRDPSKWKLYVKFCFFSGLPIAEGEMHYKVRDEIAESVYGEEIVLSHEVMEAVNGATAEMLTLPNLKAFRYLRKHYAQQCSKLDDVVFKRSAWERVAPEV